MVAQLYFVVLLIFLSLDVLGNPHVPQPYRLEASVFGRDTDYGDERFLHLFSYRHLRDEPGYVDEGLRATAGSVDSDRLYYDFRFLRSFVFDNPMQAFTLDVQRGEDFDGSFDRQIVGFRQGVGEGWQFSLRGDVLADKAGSDVYFGAKKLAEHGWLDFQFVLADAYFNDKTGTAARYQDRPYTLFFQWYHPFKSGETILSFNLSPDARSEDSDNQVNVTARQNRFGLEHWYSFDRLTLGFSVDAEYTRRKHQLVEFVLPRYFKRDAFDIMLGARMDASGTRYEAGVRYLSLREKGWYGRDLNDSGELIRTEPLAYAGMQLELSDTQTLAPTVYVSRPQVNQLLAGDWSLRQDDSWLGKLSVPWQWRISEKNGAYMTITPSFRLHRMAFGGGNVQMHWPL